MVDESPQQVAAAAVLACRELGRTDLGSRLEAAVDRLARAGVVICVVGEFKKGKSAIVNAILGADLCPVDDDLSTSALTALRWARTGQVTVHRREAERSVSDEVPASDVPLYVTEAGNPDNTRRVDLVDVAVPNPLLARGITLVDAPGVGGLNAGYATALLAYLPAADALVFVTDASAELSADELEFLSAARAVCPLVFVVVSKIDLYPAWRRIVASDTARLAAFGLPAPIPASATLRLLALQRGDQALDRESGVPALLEVIKRELLDRAERLGVERTSREIVAVIEQLRAPLEAELATLQDPAALAELAARLEATRRRLDHLGGPAARWSTKLTDGFADLTNEVDQRLRTGMRAVLRRAEEEIDRVDPAAGWPALAERFQAGAAEVVQQTFAHLAEGASALQARAARLLADDGVVMPSLGLDEIIDVRSLWSDRPITRPGVAGRLGAGIGGLRGAQGGIAMLGVLGQLFGLAVVGPAAIGAAVLFGASQVLEDRQRQITNRRQEARTFAKQFVEDVEFEVGGRIRDLAGDLERHVREQLTERIEELTRTTSEASAALEEGLKHERERRMERMEVIRRRLATLEELTVRASGIQAPR